ARRPGEVAVPDVDAVILADAERRALLLPAGQELIDREAAFDERGGDADDHLRIDPNARRRRVLVVGVHADELVAVLLVEGGGDLVGQGRRPVADRAELPALGALAPGAAVGRLQRDRLQAGLGRELLQRVLDHELAQAGVADTELRRLAPALPQ